MEKKTVERLMDRIKILWSFFH